MSRYDVIIAGAGPAGCSAATFLAEAGLSVLLLEEKRMPRPKLCGEFISPECLPTLERLGVIEAMLSAGAQRLSKLSLCTLNGSVVNAPIAEMSGGTPWAMSLSRSRLDQILFTRARAAGAVCLEGMAVKQVESLDRSVSGVEAMSLGDGKLCAFESPLVIDASGRNSRLTVGKKERVSGRPGSRLYAMKAHLRKVVGIDKQVELYFFPEGYGGLSLVEEGLVNLCFITSEQVIRNAAGNAMEVVERTVMRHPLARQRLIRAEVVGKWLTVGPLTFCKRHLSRGGVLAIGDAAGMIDPFTGTGIQIALRSGEILAESIIDLVRGGPDHKGPRDDKSPEGNTYSESRLAGEVIARYKTRYVEEFGRRMTVAGILRQAAFSPAAANLLAAVLARMPRLAGRVLRATRSRGKV